MKLQELANWNVAGRGRYRNRPVFLTPNGTKVVRLGDGYYPVTRRDKVRTDRRFLGRENLNWSILRQTAASRGN